MFSIHSQSAFTELFESDVSLDGFGIDLKEIQKSETLELTQYLPHIYDKRRTPAGSEWIYVLKLNRDSAVDSRFKKITDFLVNLLRQLWLIVSISYLAFD